MTVDEKIKSLDEHSPGWRDIRYENGAPMFDSDTGMMLTESGRRSIFDDVDE